jgi:hypothetical protein
MAGTAITGTIIATIITITTTVGSDRFSNDDIGTRGQSSIRQRIWLAPFRFP